MLRFAVRRLNSRPVARLSQTRFKSTQTTSPVAGEALATAYDDDVTMHDDESTATLQAKPHVLTHSEAFVETMAAHGIKDMFGIVGSAFMDALDLFPAAGIRFISVQHEQNAAHMADGYARVSGETGSCIAQNGPGITNFVTGIAAAMHANSPVLCITPEGGTATKGHGGFQECDQMPIFQAITKAQYHVNNPTRMAELTNVALNTAARERGPVQLNIPRDYFYGEATYTIPKPQDIQGTRTAGNEATLQQAAALLANAKNPVILSGGGVSMSQGGVPAVTRLAEFLACPVATTYLHNDSFPSDHQLWTGPLGYQGSKAAMNSIKDADVVLAVGTRLGPFGTNPQYGLDYWPEDAAIIQVELDQRKVGLVKPVDVGICGDAALAAESILGHLQSMASVPAVDPTAVRTRLETLTAVKEAWESELDERSTQGETDVGEHADRMVPRAALRELEKAMPDDAMVATDIGNVCSVSNSYLRFKQPNSFLAAMTFGNCGYAFPAAMGAKVAAPHRPAVAYIGDGAWGMSLNEVLTCVRENIPTTAVVFNNRQWGAEKKNQVLWFGDRYVGTNLKHPREELGGCGFKEIAESMGAQGIRVNKLEDVGPALRKATEDQNSGITTVIELMLTRELGDPFRRDAMKLPQRRLKKYAGFCEDHESPTGQPVDLGPGREGVTSRD